MRGRRTLSYLLSVGVVATLVAVPSGASAQDPTEYSATIRRDSFGVPHVVGDSFDDVAFGIGYAFAEDNICTAADFTVTVNGERSRWFGPDGTWTFHGNGTVNNNLDSDIHYTAVNESGVIEELLALDPPNGPLPEVRSGIAGYVAGFNRYLADVGGPEGITDPRCRGAEWVRPITEMDAYRRFFQLASLASAGEASWKKRR